MVELADASGCQQIQISGVTVANNNWHYVVFTWNDSIYLYMDGASVMTPTARTKTPKSDVYNLWIGDSHVYTSASYSGSMDEVAIWNRTLSANEVKALYYGGVTGGSVLNSSLLSNGDNWTVEVTPCDYLECGTPKNSSVLSIMNAPTQGTPLLNSTDYPTNRTTGNLTAWNQSTVQVPGRNVTNIYRWFKNGVLNASMPNPFYDVGSNNTTQGLVLYLPLNNDTKDYSGLGNHGTSIAGVDCGIGISGKIGTGCSFPGSHSYINITNGIISPVKITPTPNLSRNRG